jgi:hypothetical protein
MSDPKKELERRILLKQKQRGVELALDGSADASIRGYASTYSITIIKLDRSEFVGESPYPSQNKAFVDWAKGRKWVASASIKSTNKTKRSPDGHDYPIEQITVKFK